MSPAIYEVDLVGFLERSPILKSLLFHYKNHENLLQVFIT